MKGNLRQPQNSGSTEKFMWMNHFNHETNGTMLSKYSLDNQCNVVSSGLSRPNFVQKEIIDLRVDRFISLTKPRSISRLEAETIAVNNHNICTSYDCENDGTYDIATLNPKDIKQYQNLEAYPYAFDTDFDVLAWVTAMMTESPLANALLNDFQDSGWKLALADLDSDGFNLDITNKILEIDNFNLDAPTIGKSVFYRNAFLAILSKGLRDVWHENRWGAFEVNYKPEAVLLLERARAADADSVAILIAWELRSAGYNEVWRHVLGAEDLDMARVLINILERYPTSLYNGMALAHLFRQWYADVARVDALDHATLQQMDDMMLDGHGNFGAKLALCNEFELLSLLPDGCMYLKDLGETVSKDPFFNSLNDTVNQTHLFQIVYDSKVTYVNGIPFCDPELAQKFIN